MIFAQKNITPDIPLALKIADITEENPFVKTFWFEHELKSEPGQFVMLWIPGLEQKPFSIGYDMGNRFGLTICAVGPLSRALFAMKRGDRVGITGPCGNPFSVKENTHYITVAGGYGAGPLGVLAEKLSGKNSPVDFCIGARNKDLLLCEDRAAQLPHMTLHVATDDGSKGQKGFVTDIVEKLLNEKKHRDKHVLVSACGRELMEYAVLDLANTYNVSCELSIERYMKCGFGVCGQCCTDSSGIRMCVEGPVVQKDIANALTEFGKYHRDKAGTKHFFS